MMGGRRGRRALAIVCLVGALAAGAASRAVQRRVVGTLRVTGTVESAIEPNVWRPLTPGAAVEGMSVRTGPKGSAAVLELTNGDLIGVAENSTIQIGAGEPLRVQLEKGHVAYRLRPESGTVIETPRGTVRAPLAQGASTGSPQMGEGVVMLADGTTTVHGYRGTSELVAKDGQVTTIKSGQVATLEGDAPATTVADAGATAGAGAALPQAAAESGGAFDWFPSILGLSPGASAAVVGGVAVAGAGAGVAAGVSSGGGSSSSGVGQGSPFKNRKPKKNN